MLHGINVSALVQVVAPAVNGQIFKCGVLNRVSCGLAYAHAYASSAAQASCLIGRGYKQCVECQVACSTGRAIVRGAGSISSLLEMPKHLDI